ncbi:hypothetical protein V5799_023669 [Amblyomma americanum]|uniref:THAP-type domain-containing protein n=1 Tax=Amblyomma americanum TaxID=6943 RepID=A0AAQ4FIB9_AMBAM
MHNFPRGEHNKLVRKRWIANLQRKGFDPGNSARVCSIHFVDGRPTPDNPYPTLHLGTPTVPFKSRSELKARVVISPRLKMSPERVLEASRTDSIATQQRQAHPITTSSLGKASGASRTDSVATYQRPAHAIATYQRLPRVKTNPEGVSEASHTDSIATSQRPAHPIATYQRSPRRNEKGTLASCLTYWYQVVKVEKAVQLETAKNRTDACCTASLSPHLADVGCQTLVSVPQC